MKELIFLASNYIPNEGVAQMDCSSKPIVVNFNDVSEALDTLKKLYEADFWGTIQK